MKFRAQAIKYGYQEQAPADGTGGGTPAPAPAPAPAPQMSMEQITSALQTLLDQGQPKPSEYQSHLKNDEAEQDKKAQIKKTESAVKFNATFADKLAKNAKLFPERTKSLISGSYETETEKADKIQKFAARDFFSKPENMELLSPSQRLIVEQKLTGEHSDISLSGEEAWSLVENALYMHETKIDHLKQRGMYGEVQQGEAPPNIKAYHDKMYSKGTMEL